MPTNIQMPITDFKRLTDTDRSLIVWQGLTDTWAKLQETIEHQKEIEADTKVHDRLLITGNNGSPSIVEQLRSHQKFIDSVWKLAWIFIGAIVAQITAFAFMAVWVVARIYPILERLANQP